MTRSKSRSGNLGKGALLGVTTLSVLWTAFACSAIDSDGADRSDDAAVSESEVAVSGPAIWRAESSVSGTPVVMYPASDTIRAGAAEFIFEVEGGLPENAEVSVDLQSPQMPAHGVTRYKAHPMDDGMYHIAVEIPMQGFWALYVNFDAGQDAAGFRFDVEPGEEGPTHNHGGGMPGTESGSTTDNHEHGNH